MQQAVDVAVVGGGISGLVTALRLKICGLTTICVDPGPAWGGVIGTRHEQGFLVERGPNSTLETCPELTELIEELGLEDQRIYADELASNRYILRDGALIPLPQSPKSFLMTKLFGWKTKFRLLREPFVGRGNAGESLGDFVRRRLGNEFLDYAINPFVAGVYAGDPDQLSVEAGFPKLFALEAEYGGLIRGAIMGARKRKKRKDVSKQNARMLTFRDGLDVLPLAIRAQLGASCLGGLVHMIEKDGDGFQLQLDPDGIASVRAGAVVLAVPAEEAARLLTDLHADAAQALREIVHPSVASVALGYRRCDIEHPLDGFGFLVPEVEKRRILGTIFSSTLFPNRAPSDHVLLTSFVGGTRQPDLARQSTDALIDMVHEELQSLLGAQGEPVFRAVTHWERAIPQYDLEHLRRVTAMDDCESQISGLFLRCNFKDGISVADCVKNGVAMARRVEAFCAAGSAAVDVPESVEQAEVQPAQEMSEDVAEGEAEAVVEVPGGEDADRDTTTAV